MDETSTDTLVVGAGPAGLAVGACLRRAGVPFTIVERADRVGPSWRAHYDRLHLHTDRRRSGLPHLPIPPTYPRYPSRDQVVRYLEDYARHHELRPRFGREVSAIRPAAAGAWDTLAGGERIRSRRVVVATGYTREPVRPTWPGMERFRGPIVHSAEYRNGAGHRDRRVLVVGFGNSGGEIALDLAEHGARPTLAVRGPVNVIPRELFGIPILGIAAATGLLPPTVSDALMAPILRLRFGDLGRLGLRRSPIGPRTQVVRHARVPLIDVGTIDGIRRGAIGVRPGLERFEGDAVRFADGSTERFDAVVLATGYRPRVDRFLAAADVAGADDVVDRHGTPRTSGTEVLPGLYFCGFRVTPTGGLREIAREARRIATAIAASTGPTPVLDSRRNPATRP